jgi:hypothetical protein
MSRERKGYVVNRNGRLYVRVCYTDEQGDRHDIVRRAKNRTHARELRNEILRELEDGGAQTLNASRMTFADLARYFEEHYLKPAEYDHDGRKIEGVRSLEPARAAVNALKAFFGKRRLQTIRYSDLLAYRAARRKGAPGSRHFRCFISALFLLLKGGERSRVTGVARRHNNDRRIWSLRKVLRVTETLDLFGGHFHLTRD